MDVDKSAPLDVFEKYNAQNVGKMPNLYTLLEDNKESIRSLRFAASSVLNTTKSYLLSDDFFLLRYVLSYRGDIAKASNAIAQSIKWRKKYTNIVKKAMQANHNEHNVEFPAHLQPYIKSIRSYLAAWGHKSTRDGQPIVLVRIGCCNFNALTSVIPYDILCDYIIFSNEVEYWWCDKCSRETGFIHKTFRMIDMRGASVKTFDISFMKLFSKVSKISEFLHPQLVEKTILLHPPSILSILIDGLHTLGLSKRALGKIWVHKLNKRKTVAEHEDINVLIDPLSIPTFLGGSCVCNTGCIPGVSNDTFKPKQIDAIKERLEIDDLIHKFNMRNANA